MKKQTLMFLTLSTLALTSCSDRAFLYPNEDVKKPAYSTGSASTAADSRPPLDVPPELRNVEVPQPGSIASNPDGSPLIPAHETVAGKAVSLDARLYSADAALVFSSVIDAMTALNLPVQSVDSPSGTVTTDWVRQGVNNPNANIGSSVLSGMFGGDGVLAVRYRYVVRTLRQMGDGSSKTRLEIRTIGQAFVNKHWVNRPIDRRVSEEVFSAVEERLSVSAPVQQ